MRPCLARRDTSAQGVPERGSTSTRSGVSHSVASAPGAAAAESLARRARVEVGVDEHAERGLAGVQEQAAGSRIASPAHQEQRRRASPDMRAWRWGSTSTRSGGNHTSSETQTRRDRGGLLYAGNRAHRKSWLLWSPMQSSPSISLQARTIQGHSRAVRGRALGTLSDDR